MNEIPRNLFRWVRARFWDIQGRIHGRGLMSRFPGLNARVSRGHITTDDLGLRYADYVNNVSTSGHAISLECTLFLLQLAETIGAKKILDLGSGFSSFALRSYAMKQDYQVDVVTVDDNSLWLEKTRQFLRENRIIDENVMHWSDFCRSELQEFDLIFHDLGFMDTRVSSLPEILRRRANKGVIVLDDMHKLPYRKQAKELVGRQDLHVWSARRFTLDQYGRFAMIAVSSEP